MDASLRLLTVLTALLVSAAATDAQQITSPFRFVDEGQAAGGVGGYVFTGDAEIDLGPQPAPAFGARYGIRISGPFSAEGNLMYMPTHRTVFDAVESEMEDTTTIEPVGEADLSLLLADAALRFDLTGPRTYYGLMPFALLGVGGAIEISGGDDAGADLESDERFDFGTTFTGTIGAGVEWFATPHLTMRFDARDILWQVDMPAAFQRVDLDVPEDQWLQNFALSLSIGYRF